MRNIYYYTLSYDGGKAPCVMNRLLTLAICKPDIRRVAGEDDWVLGFAPREDGWRLRYAAQLGNPILGRSYYMSPRYRHRRDCIYEWKSSRFELRRNVKFHKTREDLLKDVGSKTDGYKNAIVLPSRKFWYFGENAKPLSFFLPNEGRALRRKLHRLYQKHRVNHTEAVKNDLLSILRRLKRMKGGKLGDPADGPRPCSYNSTSSKSHGCAHVS